MRILVFLVALGALSQGLGQSADIRVTSTVDGPLTLLDGSCTLRKAVVTANSDVAVDGCLRLANGLPQDRIILPDTSYRLDHLGAGEELAATGDLDLTDPVQILATAASAAVIDAGALGDRVFDIHPAAGSVSITSVQIFGPMITDNGAAIRNQASLTLNQGQIFQTRTDGSGGGIYSSGNLAVNDSFIAGTTAAGNACTAGGGGIFMAAGTLVFANSMMEAVNASSGFASTEGGCGGCIHLASGSTGVIENSQLNGCTAYRHGGGIYSDGTLVMIGSTLGSGRAMTGDGGGLASGPSGVLTVRDSFLTSNSADVGMGGGLAFGGSPGFSAFVANATFSSNSAASGGDHIASSGGSSIEPVQLRNLTLSDNTTGAEGIRVTGGAAQVSRSILDFPMGDACNVSGGTLVSDGFNLDSNGTCEPLTAGGATPDLIGVPPLLDGGPANHGGPANTIALQSASPAIDAGSGCDDGLGGVIGADARGIPRPIYNDCDIGAHEATPLINEIDSDTPGSNDSQFVEISDGGIGGRAGDGLVLVFFDGDTDASYLALDLDGLATSAGGYLVAGNPGLAAAINFPVGVLQTGADAVALYAGNAADFPNGTGVHTSRLLDAVVYGNDHAQDAELASLLAPFSQQINENERATGDFDSIQRCPDSAGVPGRSNDFAQFAPSPGAVNACADLPGSGPLFRDSFEL